METRRTASPGKLSGLVLVALAWALFLALTGSPEAILFTVPVFLLAAPLALGRYVGEDVIAAIREGIRPRSRREPRIGLAHVVAHFPVRLQAGHIPVRGPPATAV